MIGTFPSEIVRRAVAEAIGQSSDNCEITIRPAAPHQTNRLFDVRTGGKHLITKEYLRADRPDAPQNEYAALRRLAAFDLAPRPVFYDPSLGPVVVYQYMEGSMWDRRIPSPAELRALAELWIRFHSLPIEGFWLSTRQTRSWNEVEARLRAPVQAYASWTERHSGQVRDAARLSLDVLDRSLANARRLSSAETRLCFCRSDARFANVIARPDGRLGLVDWEDSGLRDPATEVADLLMHPNQEDLLSWAAWQPFLSTYIESRREDPGFEPRLQGALALFPIFWLGILLEDGMQRSALGTFDAWQINEMEPNARLRRYMARARAWPDPDPVAALANLGDLTFF
ncbi:MAG: phosphotransferase [Chloroflexi bacterium]|nr:phosphotransferase [Chloroflexota bacterium]